jgi:DNA-binding response OmpR family regulator
MRILLVEDNAELVSLVVKGLQRSGLAAKMTNKSAS